jgi:AcrR family transcriptional regulator
MGFGMAGRRRISREAIIEQAQRIVGEQGTAALTFQALAAALGVSKQAIIYWYPSKWELVRDVSLPALKTEATVTVAAVQDAESAPEAIERFVRALIAHHLADLGKFRMLYLAPQFDNRATLPSDAQAILRPIHETTSSMYAALASKIAGDPHFLASEHPRRLAVAAHTAGIGLLTMLALAESVEDPLAHETGALVDSLVALLTGRTGTGVA